VTPELPLPPINGLRLQVGHLAQELAVRHEVCVLGYRWPEQEADGAGAFELRSLAAPSRALPVRALDWLGAAVQNQPAAVGPFTGHAEHEVARLVSERRFDVAHVTSPVMARLKHSLGSVPSILAALDAWHLNLLASAAIGPRITRPLRRLEARRARRFESRALGWYERVVMVTAEDAAAVHKLNPSLPLEVIPNGVDASRFAPAAVPLAERGHIVFTGALAYPPNVAAAHFLALRILPRVRRKVADAHLTIVGRSPCRTVRALASPGVVDVVADVPEVRPWLQRAEVYACPMISGTGIKNKLLEALACGSPAVATALSCQGMSVRSEEQLLIADGEERFAEAVVRLMDDPALRARLAASARKYVLQDHNWPEVARSYERIYSEVIDAATG